MLFAELLNKGLVFTELEARDETQKSHIDFGEVGSWKMGFYIVKNAILKVIESKSDCLDEFAWLLRLTEVFVIEPELNWEKDIVGLELRVGLEFESEPKPVVKIDEFIWMWL